LTKGQHLMMDCSQGIACVYRWSGLGNPSDDGPQLIRLSKQRTVHRGPVTFLDVSGIGPA
jgi:hypothetical protein